MYPFRDANCVKLILFVLWVSEECSYQHLILYANDYCFSHAHNPCLVIIYELASVSLLCSLCCLFSAYTTFVRLSLKCIIWFCLVSYFLKCFDHERIEFL